MNARLPQHTQSTSTSPTVEKETTVFMSGNSQAVRIPKEFQRRTRQVSITLRGDELVIKPKYRTGADILANLPPLSPEDENDTFDLAALVHESNRKLPTERDLSHLLASKTSKTKPKIKLEARVKTRTVPS